MSKAVEEDKFYRIPADNRNLNYDNYQFKGNSIQNIDDYNSHNTTRLNIDQIKKKLMSLEIVKNAL